MSGHGRAFAARWGEVLFVVDPTLEAGQQRYEARESMDIMLQDFAPTSIADAYKERDAFLLSLVRWQRVSGVTRSARPSPGLPRG